MPAFPVLMVQYINDTTEVRYSDGSRLELSPCGSVFQYEEARPESRHPVQGVDVIQQRSAFVTSQYRDKLIEALDFRNRFAERPYICQELFSKEDIVQLYSNIVEAAWPSTTDDAEVLQDGSIRLTSQDEFASLVFSPHGRDFTVCYLSKTSTCPPSSQLAIPKRQHSSPVETRVRHVSAGSNSGVSDKSDGSFKLPGKPSKRKGSSRRKHKGSQFGSLTVEPSATSAFVAIVPAQRPHQHRRQSSNPRYSDGESSSHSVQSYDSLTSSIEDELCSSYHDLNIQAASKSRQNPSAATSSVLKSRPQGRRGNQENFCPHVSPGVSPISKDLSPLHTGTAWCSIDGGASGENQSKCRQYYCWVTQHVSCSDCPRYWEHPARLVQEKWRKLQAQADDSDHEKETNGSDPSSLSCGQRDTIQNDDKSQVCMCELPPPVALTCPGQHLHSWSPSTDIDLKGKVKVVMSEGVIYRLVGSSSLHQVEIYPGDNSVLTSQGLTGHFFLHIIPRADNPAAYLVEEKTYSVKVPPQDFPGEAYSLAKLISKGAQYLATCDVDVQFKSHAEVFCWKYNQEKTAPNISEARSTVKCEHNIPGLGKFLAYTNGKIRIVFADRTALDMMSESCKDGSPSGSYGDGDGSQPKVTCDSVYRSQKARVWGELIPAGHCRLLLPSGQYTLVKLSSPGPYKTCVDYALEWCAWCNTPVRDRTQFYANATLPNSSRDVSPDTELRKINCFNYVVENTVLKHQSLGVGPSGDGCRFAPLDGLCYRTSDAPSVTTSTNSSDNDQIKSFDDVRRALQKTSRVISDIDSLLSARK
ncbi:uncharacterized protein C5orf34 homolog [Liolophura sinensis]|uniref:uncharacterized protein C5orf34 homolog n=1 Tax=Liolophura sinensis TaxID=3198878 RepID=UPI0031599008